VRCRCKRPWRGCEEPVIETPRLDAEHPHSQGAIDALRDAPEQARYNPQVTIVTIDPPRTSILFRCVPGARYFNLHTSEFGLGGGSMSCPEAQNVATGGLHATLPMRSDVRDRILGHLREDQIVEREPTDVVAVPIESTPLPPIGADPLLQKSSVTTAAAANTQAAQPRRAPGAAPTGWP
jgi:hypothetical protein